MLLKLARLSLWNRRTTGVLTLISLAISVALVLGINHLRQQAKESFAQTLSGTDLVVGARGGQLNLLLYSVFRIGNATQEISWQSYSKLNRHPNVAWTIPLALGDSHKGFRVLGTTEAYFEHYRYGQSRPLEIAEGRAFRARQDAVLGSKVAEQLGYQLGNEFAISHGTVSVSFAQHDDHPFRVVGILAPTGTPVDQTLHVTLEGLAAAHTDSHIGAQQSRPQNQSQGHDHARPPRLNHVHQPEHHSVTPESVSAVVVGLSSRAATFSVQRQINTYEGEALMAVLPGVALNELWQMLSTVENLLFLISALVLLATLVGMMTMLLASMKERERELAVLRALGAGGWSIFWLLQLEVLMLTLGGLILGSGLLTVGLWLAQPVLATHFGLFVGINPLGGQGAYIIVGILVLAALVGCVPARVAYRRALSEGLTPRL